MTLNLKDIFGHCIIPRKTFLFRGHNSTHFRDCMFFASKFWVARVFNDSVQIWETKKEIEILFLVESVDSRSWSESSIPRLFKTVFPDTDNGFDDLDVKHHDIKRRNDFISSLRNDYNIQGWLASLEGAIELEICLFSNNQIELKETVLQETNKYTRDSLNQIQIFPTQEFYERTYKKLSNGSPNSIDKEMLRNRYLSHFGELVKENTTNSVEIGRNKDKFNNLRVRLNI